MTPILIGICVLVFLVQSGLSPEALEKSQYLFGLSERGLLEGYWWQFITYAFLHGSFMHLFVNMLGLWFSGRMLEPVIGPARLLILYLFASLLGGILQLVLVGGEAVLLGASASVFGIIIAFATIFPMAELMVILVIIPLRMKARTLAYVLMGSTLVFLLTGFESWIGHAAHLGGGIGGFIFARLSGFAAPSRLELVLTGPVRRFFRRSR